MIHTTRQSLISFRIPFAASTGSQIDGPGQERTAGAAGAGEGQRLHEDLYDNHKQLRQYTGAVFAKGELAIQSFTDSLLILSLSLFLFTGGGAEEF